MILFKRTLVLGLFLISLCLSAPTSAVEFRRIGQDYRSLAMGNTGIASANNNAALFYNPATMANIFDWWISLPTIQLTYSDEAYPLIENIVAGTTPEPSSLITDFMGQHPFIKLDAGASFYMNMDKRGMTIGGNYNYEYFMDIEVVSTPEARFFSRLDHIQQVGISYPVGLGQLVLGVSYKVINRQDAEFVYGAAQIIDPASLTITSGEGRGGGYDIGFIYRFNTRFRMQMGGVYRSPISIPNAEDIPEEVAMGIMFSQEFQTFRITGAMDWRDMTNKLGSPGDSSLNKRLHYGLEIGYLPLTKTTSMISLRTGYNQGYLTDANYLGFSGIEVALGKGFVIGYTKYTEEIGEYAGQTPSQRTMIYLSLGF